MNKLPIAPSRPFILEQEQFFLTRLFSLVGLFFVLGFSVESYFNEALSHALFLLLLAGVLALNLVYLRSRKSSKLPAWIFTLSMALLIVHLLLSGGERGSGVLWCYAYPPLVFYVIGVRGGLIANLAIGVIAILLWLAGGLEVTMSYYSTSFHFRFIASLSVVAILSFLYEFSRERRQQDLLRKQIELEEALAEIKTLSGILPICSFCNKIRDDDGYWQKVENYISERSEAMFSHGLCPDCVEEHYGEFLRDKRKKK